VNELTELSVSHQFSWRKRDPSTFFFNNESYCSNQDLAFEVTRQQESLEVNKLTELSVSHRMALNDKQSAGTLRENTY